MDSLETSLGQIKDGITDMIHRCEANEKRMDAFETYLKDRKPSNGKGLSLPGSGGSQKVSFAKIIAAQVLTREGVKDAWDRVDGKFERGIVEEATRKALDSGIAGSGGGYVVPSGYIAEEFIDSLRANAVVLKAGATFLPDLTGKPVVVPKQASSGTVYWLGENSTITASDAGFGNVQLTPKTMGMRPQHSRLVDILSNPKLEELIRNDMARVAALELDRVALRGSGSSNQPLGIANVPRISSYAIGTNGGSLQVDHLYDLLGLIEDNNVPLNSLALISHPKALRKLKKQKVAQFSGDTGGSYVVNPLLSDEALSKAIGLTCLSTTQLPTNLVKGSSSDCTEVYLANWSELLLGQWGGLEILATNIGGSAWAQNAIEVRLIMNVDVQVRHAQSFVLCNDVRTA